MQGLGAVLQIVLIVLWYTVLPDAPAWVIFLPAIVFAVTLGVLLLFSGACFTLAIWLEKKFK